MYYRVPHFIQRELYYSLSHSLKYISKNWLLKEQVSLNLVMEPWLLLALNYMDITKVFTIRSFNEDKPGPELESYCC